MSKLLEAALWYAKNHWHVFPLHGVVAGDCTCGKKCDSPGKHPRIRRGCLQASADPMQIKGWWAKWPDSNIGMATGYLSGVDVLDVDPRSGGDENLSELERKFGELPATVMSITGGGGAHVFFEHTDVAKKNSTGLIAPGLDLKTSGGYVVLPPSNHISGRQYTWEGASGPSDVRPAPYPEWLRELIRATGGNGARPSIKPVEDQIPEGQRNHTLASLGGSMRRRGMSADEINTALLAVNIRRCTPPLPADEVRRIAENISRYEPKVQPQQQQKPNTPEIVTLSELATLELVKPSFLIENIITGPGAWSLIGSHKAGKTLFAAQLALSYHAPAHFLDYYRTVESRGALFVEQDDPAGLATVQQIIQRSPIPKDESKFFTVRNANFTIGDRLVAFLEREIESRNLGLIVLDSYTAMRSSRGSGVDIVKAEANDFGILDRLAKRTGSVVLILHHRSRGNSALEWSEQTAGTYAIGMATEGEIHISRFRDLASTAGERLVQIRGRRFEGLELVIRFRPETLDYEFVCDGGAASLFPVIQQIKTGFANSTFTPKDLSHELGVAKATATRLIGRLTAAGVITRQGYGEYRLMGAM